jgi:hypothetical protein
MRYAIRPGLEDQVFNFEYIIVEISCRKIRNIIYMLFYLR